VAGLGLHQAQPVPGPSKAASSGRLTSTPRSPSLATCTRGGLSVSTGVLDALVATLH